MQKTKIPVPYLISAVLFICEGALQVSGYVNHTLAIILLILAVLVLIYAIYGSFKEINFDIFKIFNLSHIKAKTPLNKIKGFIKIKIEQAERLQTLKDNKNITELYRIWYQDTRSGIYEAVIEENISAVMIEDGSLYNHFKEESLKESINIYGVESKEIELGIWYLKSLLKQIMTQHLNKDYRVIVLEENQREPNVPR